LFWGTRLPRGVVESLLDCQSPDQGTNPDGRPPFFWVISGTIQFFRLTLTVPNTPKYHTKYVLVPCHSPVYLIAQSIGYKWWRKTCLIQIDNYSQGIHYGLECIILSRKVMYMYLHLCHKCTESSWRTQNTHLWLSEIC
jgi:hypothetical protein